MRSSIYKHDQSGASLLEYAVALAILAMVFVVARNQLQVAAENRGELTLNVASTNLPCDNGILTGEECL